MTVPAMLFGGLVATLLGAGAHLITGGRLSRLIMYIFLAWLGFWGGHFLADFNDWKLLMVGPLHFGIALLFALLFLLFGFVFSIDRSEPK